MEAPAYPKVQKVARSRISSPFVNTKACESLRPVRSWRSSATVKANIRFLLKMKATVNTHRRSTATGGEMKSYGTVTAARPAHTFTSASTCITPRGNASPRRRTRFQTV
jgi:hypothetical protein